MMDSLNCFDKENYVKLCLFWYRLEYDILFFRGMWFVYFLKVDICILFFVDIKWNEKDIN